MAKDRDELIAQLPASAFGQFTAGRICRDAGFDKAAFVTPALGREKDRHPGE